MVGWPFLRSAAGDVQSWGHQVFVDSADDPRIWQFVDLMVFHPGFSPEPCAPCDSPSFLADPQVAPAG